jgi:hypothetical protein
MIARETAAAIRCRFAFLRRTRKMKKHIFIAVLLAALFAGCEDMMQGVDTGSKLSVKPDPAAKFLAELTDPAVTTITVTESFYIADNVTVDTPKTIIIAEGYTVSAPSLTVNADLTLNGAPVPPSQSTRGAFKRDGRER